jgi:hypothetical protein
MEYRPKGGSGWTGCSSVNITGLASGVYEVRLKATESAFAGQTATTTVKPVRF